MSLACVAMSAVMKSYILDAQLQVTRFIGAINAKESKQLLKNLMKIIINTYKKMKTIILILLALTLMSCSTGRFFTKYQMTDNNKKTYYVDTFQIENDSIKFDEVIYRLHKLVPYKFELKKIIITKSK